MGHGNHQIEVTSTQPYDFKSRNKIIAIVMIVIGLVAVVAQFATGYHQTWGNLLMNNFYFMVIALAGTFFLALQYVAEVGWSVVVKRMLEAMSQYLIVAGVIMVLIVFFGGHHLYHWMHAEVTDPKSPEYDAIIDGKSGYLNPVFFWIRMIGYFVIWYGFARFFRKESIKMDADLAGADAHYFRLKRFGAAFIVLFGITESTSAWDFIMSIETHWFSTLFGWYTFAGMFVTSFAVLMFIVTYLKSKGYLPEVTDHHLHDIGKFMFAFSIFWTYLWFAQFMLIWYSNIPEEITYFELRQDHYRGLWLGSFFINFIVPFIVLMSRDAKRKMGVIMFMSVVLFIGHWMDMYIMVIPGSMVMAGNEHHQVFGQIGWMEIATTIGFLGMFMYVVQYHLSKAPLMIKNHPMMDESLHHATI
ncbi:MAG: quinol:cytochrome C oxidoreductase [Bacteroidota bacterium]